MAAYFENDPLDYEDSLLQRLHYATTNDQHFRSIVLAWTAMVPLLLAFGLDRPARVFAGVLGLAILDGSVLALVALHRLGFITVREVLVIPILSIVGAGAWALVTGSVPRLRAPEASLYLAVVMIAINGIGLAFVAAGPALLSAERYRH